MAYEHKVIIGITGAANTGKDTVANMFMECLTKDLHDTAEIIRLADPLKEAAAVMCGVPRKDFEDREFKESKCSIANCSNRELLQKLGTDVAKQIDPMIWVNIFKRRAGSSFEDFIIVPDVRFDDEARAISENRNGFVIKLERPNVKSDLSAKEKQHVSERGVNDELVHWWISNDSSLADLKNKVLDTLDMILNTVDYDDCYDPSTDEPIEMDCE